MVHGFIDKEKVCAALRELATLLETRIKTKKNTLCIRIQSITMTKAICWIQHTHKKIEAEKNSGEGEWKRWKSIVPKLMNNAVYGKTVENLRNIIDVKLVSNKKYFHLKWTSKPSYLSQKLFDNNLVAIHKNKVTLTFNKSAYVGMCVLELSKVLIYEFHYDYIKNKYGNNSGIIHKHWQFNGWN